MLKQFEYQALDARRDAISLVMNKQGENGWELVSAFVDPDCKKVQVAARRYQLIFKRPKTKVSG